MPNDNPTWLDTAHNTATLMLDTAVGLRNLAWHLECVLGDNSPVAPALRRHADDLAGQSKLLTEATGAHLSENLHQARELSGLLLKATLAGCIAAQPGAEILDTINKIGGPHE